MSNSIQDQTQEGKTELQKGNQDQAHQIFLQVLKQEPQNIMALLYAGASASGREEAEHYLKQAEEIDPDNASIQKGLQWAQNLPSKPFKKPPVKKAKSERLSSGPIDRSALLLFGGLIFLSVLIGAGLFGYNLYLKSRPTTQEISPTAVGPVEEQAAQDATAEPVPTQAKPESLPPTWTPEPSPTQRSIPTYTVQPELPGGVPSIISDGRFTANLPSLPLDDQEYSIVETQILITSPDDFQDQYLQLTLPIMHLGTATIDGINQYVILLDPGQDAEDTITPIVIFGFLNNNENIFEVGQMLTVYGAGLGQIDLDEYFALEDNILPEDMYQEGQNRILPSVAGMIYSQP